MTQVTLSQIKDHTKQFFDLHWPEAWQLQPDWNDPWYFQGTLSGHDKQGVYALLTEDESVLYIGVGASFVGGLYEGHGIGARVNNYWRQGKEQESTVQQRIYEPVDIWKDRGLHSIASLGMEPEQAYLAYALEAFLLSRFAPPYNRIRSARINNS